MPNHKPKLDKDRLVQYGEILERTLRDWEENATGTTLRELQDNRQKCLFLCYAMEASIQTTLDIANHLIAANAWEKPGTYREAFQILERHGIVNPLLCKELQRLAGFRNVLVHRYPELKLPLVHENLKKSHRFIRGFLRLLAELAG